MRVRWIGLALALALVGAAAGYGLGALRRTEPVTFAFAHPVPAVSPSIPIEPTPSYAPDIDYPPLGTDLTYKYDAATGKFTMSYQADPTIDAPTHIFVSPLTAPHGYTVTTNVGTVTKNGSYVDLDVDSATTVNLTITPVP